MYDLFAATPRFRPVIVASMDANGALNGILLGVNIREMRGPLGFFSSRVVVYGGPLLRVREEEEEEIADMLLRKLITETRRESLFIQFRNFYDMRTLLNVFDRNGFEYHERLNLLVDTGSAEEVKKNMSGSKWRQVQKGLRAGARIIEPENTGQLREFYNILHTLYKYKVRKPLPPWRFFRDFMEAGNGRKPGIILLVEYKGKIIGGILCPITPGRTIYEWYVCGLDQKYKSVYPSVLATWAAIDYALKNNIPEFDFMGVGLPDKDYGVRVFKTKFGGKMVNYGRFARINNQSLYSLAELGYNVLALLKKI